MRKFSLQRQVEKKRIWTLLFFVFVLVFASYNYIGFNHFLSIDLRNRIIGARCISSGISPYFFHWSPKMPVTLYNPYDTDGLIVNHCTASPALCQLFIPVSWLSFRVIQSIWYWFHFAVILIVYMLALRRIFFWKQYALLTLLFTVFILSDGWMTSLNYGENYFLYAALLAAGYLQTKGERSYRFFFWGICLGTVIYLRPFYLLLGVPLLFFEHKKATLKGLGCIILIIALQLFVFRQLHYWQDYYKAVSIHMKLFSSGRSFLAYPIYADQYPVYDKDEVPNIDARHSVAQISDAGTLVKFFFNQALPNRFFTGLYGCLLAVYLIAAIKKPAKHFKIEDYLIEGFLLYLLFEYLSNLSRWGYYYTEWLFPLVIFSVQRSPLFTRFRILFLIGMLFCSFGKYIPYGILTGEYLLIVLLCRYFYLNRFSTRKQLRILT